MVIGFAGSTAAAPGATPHKLPSGSLQQLRAQVRSLRAQVHALRAQRTALRRALAGELAGRAKREARLTRPLRAAVAQVGREVRWAQGSTTAPLGGQLVAEAAMDYVVGHVSTGAYGYLELLFGEPPGGADLPSYYESVNRILGSQTGICVHAERTFAAIVHRLGLRVRDVGFDFVDPGGQPDSHAAAEVYYDGGWHFFDPTFGQFWTDGAGRVLSIADVRAAGGIVHRDGASFTNLIEDPQSPAGGDAWFETDPKTTVVIVG
jgi:hypothetical protein